jgi:hypothetical protein
VAIALDSQIEIMKKNLSKLEPQLKELVEMEHAWLEEEEKKAGKCKLLGHITCLWFCSSL